MRVEPVVLESPQPREAELRGYMTPIRIGNVDEAVVRKLRQRAARHGHSMNDELCQILSDAVSDERLTKRSEIAMRVKRRQRRSRRLESA